MTIEASLLPSVIDAVRDVAMMLVAESRRPEGTAWRWAQGRDRHRNRVFSCRKADHPASRPLRRGGNPRASR